MTHRAVIDFNNALWDKADEERICIDGSRGCGWPEGCHPHPIGRDRAARDERELGIPTGTFVAIRRLWRNRVPFPPRYGCKR